MDESEDWKVAGWRCSFGRDVDVQIQPVNVGHLHRITIIVQGMLHELEFEVCSIWKGEDLWSDEMVSECTCMNVMLSLPVHCGVDGIVLRILLHPWRRKPVDQRGILQSQISCHMFTIGIANNFPNGRVVEDGGNHVCNKEIQYAKVYSKLMQEPMYAYLFKYTEIDMAYMPMRRVRAGP